MVQKSLSNDSGIQESQRNRIPVKLLPGRDSLCRNIHALALVVLRNAFMSLVVVIFLNEQFLVPVRFLQRFDHLRLAFRDIGVNQPVIRLYFALALACIRFCPEMPDAQAA